VYIFGAIAFLTIAFFSDRFGIRGPFLFLANIPGIIGYILLLTTSHNGVKYFATFLCAVAVYNGPGLNLTWLNVNMAPHYRRATAIGFQQTMANTAGIVAGQIYRKSPYKLGHSFSLGALCVGQLLIVANWFYLRSLNRQRANIASGKIEDTRKIKTGDQAVDFVYHL
jgi:Na+/melibiose symporter-like transporter